MENTIIHIAFTGNKITKGVYMTNKRKKLIEKYNSGQTTAEESEKAEELMRLFEMSKQAKSIDEQFKDVTRASSRGV